MPQFDKQAKALQKKIRRLVDRYGTTIKRVRPEYIDDQGNTIVEKVDFFKGIPGQLHRSETPTMTDGGGLSMDGRDDHTLSFDDLADVIETDYLIINGFQWKVSRWDPEKFGDYTIMQTVGVNREKRVDAL